MSSQDQMEQVMAAARALDVDVFYLSGPVNRESADALRQQIPGSPRSRCTLVLTTYGGRPDAAYLVARDLRAAYPGGVTVCVFGYCKSAGTLLALGATRKIVMGTRGELGPLDVQISEKDELGRYGSGLEIFESLDVLKTHSFYMFQRFLRATVAENKGRISTRTAVEIATELTLGLMSPISSQIDPLRLGRRQRALDIAERYAIRLGVPAQVARWLTTGYPYHGFVIDRLEAQDVLGRDKVRRPTEEESRLEAALSGGSDLCYLPAPEPVMLRLSPRPRDAHSKTPQGDHHDADEDRTRDSAGAAGQRHGDGEALDQAHSTH